MLKRLWVSGVCVMLSWWFAYGAGTSDAEWFTIWATVVAFFMGAAVVVGLFIVLFED